MSVSVCTFMKVITRVFQYSTMSFVAMRDLNFTADSNKFKILDKTGTNKSSHKTLWNAKQLEVNCVGFKRT